MNEDKIIKQLKNIEDFIFKTIKQKNRETQYLKKENKELTNTIKELNNRINELTDKFLDTERLLVEKLKDQTDFITKQQKILFENLKQ